MESVSKSESKLEYKNDGLRLENQATSQIKIVLEDINKVVENMNRLTKVNESTNKSTDQKSNGGEQKRDEIPLIDDSIEETSEQIKLKCDETHDNNDHSITKSITQSCTPSYVQYNNQLNSSNQTVACLHRMMNNFESIRLNEDESIESVGSEMADLSQLNSNDLNPDEQEEKERLIQQLLELRNTLDDLSNRVSSVREMSFKLTNENNVLNQYVENLMSASSVFQSTASTNSTNFKRRLRKM